MLSWVKNDNSQSPGETNTNTDATDAIMVLNNNVQKPIKTNVKKLPNDQHGTDPAHIDLSPEHQYDQ